MKLKTTWGALELALSRMARGIRVSFWKYTNIVIGDGEKNFFPHMMFLLE
jgi:hypothetical protein